MVKNISREVWAAVIKKLPNLRVTLGFDSTCPLFKLSEVMQPEIPVTVLRMETYTDLASEIRLAASYYWFFIRYLFLLYSFNECGVLLLSIDILSLSIAKYLLISII